MLGQKAIALNLCSLLWQKDTCAICFGKKTLKFYLHSMLRHPTMKLNHLQNGSGIIIDETKGAFLGSLGRASRVKHRAMVPQAGSEVEAPRMCVGLFEHGVCQVEVVFVTRATEPTSLAQLA